MLIGPQTVKPRPSVNFPKPPIGRLHRSPKGKKKKQQQQSEPFSHWSPRPQAGEAVYSPIGQFSLHAHCQSLSSGQSGYSTCGTFWNYEKEKKGTKKERRMMMNREVGQSGGLARKTNRRWEELPSLVWNLFFWNFFIIFLLFLFCCFCPFCPSVSRLSVSLFQTADFSAMHHGTIGR